MRGGHRELFSFFAATRFCPAGKNTRLASRKLFMIAATGDSFMGGICFARSETDCAALVRAAIPPLGEGRKGRRTSPNRWSPLARKTRSIGHSPRAYRESTFTKWLSPESCFVLAHSITLSISFFVTPSVLSFKE
jgi:hypothetical protein